MATGKTTVGRIMARRLGRTFIDLDRATEQVAGVSVSEIFRTQGEPAFRRHEAEALERSLALAGAIVACGGGTPCHGDNLELMLSRGRVVALTAPLDEILRRTGKISGRPLLDQAADPAAAARALLMRRQAFYARAPLSIDTVGKNAQAVADDVIAALGEKGEA
jgi:shikimate kinase